MVCLDESYIRNSVFSGKALRIYSTAHVCINLRKIERICMIETQESTNDGSRKWLSSASTEAKY